MHFTPDDLEAVYRLLSGRLPFRRWRLPDADTVEFVVSMHNDRIAHHRAYQHDKERHEIAVSQRYITSLAQLVEAMAHEMCHIRDEQLGVTAHHGPSFMRIAKLVCRRNGFDFESFI